VNASHLIPSIQGGRVGYSHRGRQQCCAAIRSHSCSRNVKYSFPKRHRSRKKKHFGYQTGDLARAVVPSGKYQGVHVGRVLARASGSFDIDTSAGKAQGISQKYCRGVHRSDGYSYQAGKREATPTLPPEKERFFPPRHQCAGFPEAEVL